MMRLPRIRVFYDGTCGLCHRFVLFILSNMEAEIFIFSPQSGSSFKTIQNSELNFGESIAICLENSAKVYYKADAIKIILTYLKYPWNWLGSFLKCFPSPLLNFLYDCVARIRHRFFKKPKEACPIVPASWLKFFED